MITMTTGFRQPIPPVSNSSITLGPTTPDPQRRLSRIPYAAKHQLGSDEPKLAKPKAGMCLETKPQTYEALVHAGRS